MLSAQHKLIPMGNFRIKLGIFSVLIFISSLGSCLGLNNLTLEQKVGQIFMVGVAGQEITPLMQLQLNRIKPGGILLFKRNIADRAQLKNLAASLQLYSKVPLLIALDQEGGAVTRLSTSPRLPSARWVGGANDVVLTERLGNSMGTILRQAGINMNLAPVLDVGNIGSRGFLRSRTYSTDAEIVGNLGLAFSQGLLRAGVIPTAKHFPGLGGVTGDPHLESVKQYSSFKEIQTKHLSPFRKFGQLFPAAVMLSHAKYPALGTTNAAPFSPEISKALLRDEVGFHGLTITDDLMMTGAGDRKIGLQERVVRIFNSGSDILLIAWSSRSQYAAYSAILRAVKNKQISLTDLNARVEKILLVKAWLAEKEKSRSLASSTDFDLRKTIEALSLVRRRSARK
jgi:beta-N-acetylhexosaminidase